MDDARGRVPLRCCMPAGHPEGLCAWNALGVIDSGAAVGHSGGGGAVGHGGYTISSVLHFYDCGIHPRSSEWEPQLADNRCPICFSAVDHPPHYGGADSPYEVIKVILAWGLGFCLGNVVKYVARAGKKRGTETPRGSREGPMVSGPGNHGAGREIMEAEVRLLGLFAGERSPGA